MKSSCTKHPANQRMIVLREWEVEATGSVTGGMLLAFFAYWHDIRVAQSEKAKEQNEVSERHGDKGTQDTGLYQFHTAKQLSAAVFGNRPKGAIAEAVERIVELGFVTVHRNPNPRYSFDATKHFLYHPDVVNKWIAKKYPIDFPPAGDEMPPAGNDLPPEGDGLPPAGTLSNEIAFKITPETPSEKKNAPRKRDGSFPSDHQLLIDTWSDAYQAQHGHRYGFAGGKDASAVKRLLTYEPSVQAIMDVATRAWTTATGFLFDQSLTLAGFASQWNVLANGKANGKGQGAPAPGRAVAAPRVEVAKAPAAAKANDGPQVLRGPAAWDPGWAELRYPDVYGRPDPKAPVLRDNMTREEAIERMAWFAESEKIRNARAAVDRAEYNVVAASKKAGTWSGDFKQLYLSDPGVAEAAKELQTARAALKALEPKEAK